MPRYCLTPLQKLPPVIEYRTVRYFIRGDSSPTRGFWIEVVKESAARETIILLLAAHPAELAGKLISGFDAQAGSPQDRIMRRLVQLGFAELAPVQPEAAPRPWRSDKPNAVAYVRLKIVPPFRLTWKDENYDFEFLSLTMGTNSHQLIARMEKAGSYWTIGARYLDRDYLTKAALEIGLCVNMATFGYELLDQLIQDGRAELVPAPANDLVYEPPRRSDPIGPPGTHLPSPSPTEPRKRE